MKLINLTPHAINFVTDAGTHKLQPSGKVARVELTYKAHKKIKIDGHRIGIESVRTGAIIGLPEPQSDTYYIVSSLVAHAAIRRDVLSPGNLLRDENGNVIGCEGLLIPETATAIHRDGHTPDILRLHNQGMRGTEIADELGISPQLVSAAIVRHRKSTTFSDAELCLIVDAHLGTRHMEGLPYTSEIISNVAGAMVDQIDEKWEVDRGTLLKKLNLLTEYEAKTLTEKVYAFWEAAPHTDIVKGLREAGL